jgi:hypothetical protein
MPTRATIWPITRFGRTQWVGNAYGTPPWRIDDQTSSEADLSHAKCLMAVIAESLFDPDYRFGSSLDELVVAFGMVGTAATKTGCTLETLSGSTLANPATRLKLYERQVFEISAESMRKRAIQGRRVRSLLAPIEERREAVR